MGWLSRPTIWHLQFPAAELCLWCVDYFKMLPIHSRIAVCTYWSYWTLGTGHMNCTTKWKQDNSQDWTTALRGMRSIGNGPLITDRVPPSLTKFHDLLEKDKVWDFSECYPAQTVVKISAFHNARPLFFVLLIQQEDVLLMYCALTCQWHHALLIHRDVTSKKEPERWSNCHHCS